MYLANSGLIATLGHGGVIVPISQMKTLRHGKVTQFVQSPTASQSQSWGLRAGLCTPKACVIDHDCGMLTVCSHQGVVSQQSLTVCTRLWERNPSAGPS